MAGSAGWNDRPGCAGRRLARRSAWCGGCGYTLSRLSDGSRGYENYRCRKRHGGGVCPDPTGISVAKADEFVSSLYLEWVAAEEIRARGRQVDAELAAAVEQMEAAQDELASYMNTTLASKIGTDVFEAGALDRQRVVDETAAEVARLRRAASPAST